MPKRPQSCQSEGSIRGCLLHSSAFRLNCTIKSPNLPSPLGALSGWEVCVMNEAYLRVDCLVQVKLNPFFMSEILPSDLSWAWNQVLWRISNDPQLTVTHIRNECGAGAPQHRNEMAFCGLKLRHKHRHLNGERGNIQNSISLNVPLYLLSRKGCWRGGRKTDHVQEGGRIKAKY